MFDDICCTYFIPILVLFVVPILVPILYPFRTILVPTIHPQSTLTLTISSWLKSLLDANDEVILYSQQCNEMNNTVTNYTVMVDDY